MRPLSPGQHARTVCALALVGASLGNLGVANAEDLLRVDGHSITSEQVEALNPAAKTNPALRQQLADQLARQQLLANTVKPISPELSARIEAQTANVRRQLLAQSAADSYLAAHQIDPKALKAAYDKAVAALPDKQYWIRWIVVATPTDAKDTIDALRSGTQSFTALALQHSVGQNAELGGALGWQSDATLPAPVVAALRQVHPGQAAGPIAVDNGYAVIQIVAERKAVKPTLAQLEPQLEVQLRNAELQNHLAELARAAKVDNFMNGREAPPAATTPKKALESQHAD